MLDICSPRQKNSVDMNMNGLQAGCRQGKTRTLATHGDAIGHSHGVELPAQHAVFLDGPLDSLPQFHHCVAMSACSLPRKAGDRLRSPCGPLAYNGCCGSNIVSQCSGTAEGRGTMRTHLQGLPSHQTVAMPTCGAFFIMFSSGTPAPYSMAYRHAISPPSPGKLIPTMRKSSRSHHLGSVHLGAGKVMAPGNSR